MTGAIQKATQEQQISNTSGTARKSINTMLTSLLDSEGYRRRFQELLGARAPQFVSSIVSMVNADPNLQQAFFEAPQTVVQAALKAATYDLPIDPGLGFAYIVPFKNSIRNPDGSQTKRMEASFIMGYRGMYQLAMRSGAYRTINVSDVREGELKSYNRFTEEIDLEPVEDEDEREKLPIVGWMGHFRLLNGFEKTIYMTRKQIEAHERKHRKGQYMGKGWREDFESMAAKTVFRRLLGKWGLLSIDYKTADARTIEVAEAVATGRFDDEDLLPETDPDMITADAITVNPSIDEIVED